MTARGESLERIIENVAHMYKLKKKAYIFKRAVEKKFVQGQAVGGKVVGGGVKYMEKGGVDFNGFLFGTGRYIGFEAKQVGTKTFNLSKLQQHQFEELKMIRDNGGLAFLLIHFNGHGQNDFFRVPVWYVEANCLGFKVRRKKKGSRYTFVYEGVGDLQPEAMKAQGFLLEKNKNNVYVDLLGGIES